MALPGSNPIPSAPSPRLAAIARATNSGPLGQGQMNRKGSEEGKRAFNWRNGAEERNRTRDRQEYERHQGITHYTGKPQQTTS